MERKGYAMSKNKFAYYFLVLGFVLLSIAIIYNLLSSSKLQKNDGENPNVAIQTGSNVSPLPKGGESAEVKPGGKLSQNEIIQIESRIRDIFQHQRASVNSSLISIGGDLDQFLFGPATTGRLLKFYNHRIRTSEIKDSEEMWKLFKKEVLTREEFDRIIDESIEIHFRSYTRARKEANREIMMYGLEGISPINYEDLKKLIKAEANKLWYMEGDKIREILITAQKDVKDATSYKSKESYVEGATIALMGASLLIPPPYNFIADGAALAILAAWYIYENYYARDMSETIISTAQQKYMKDMEVRLQVLSNNTKEQFRLASVIASDRLFEAIRREITQAYPQLRKENLQ